MDPVEPHAVAARLGAAGIGGRRAAAVVARRTGRALRAFAAERPVGAAAMFGAGCVRGMAGLPVAALRALAALGPIGESLGLAEAGRLAGESAFRTGLLARLAPVSTGAVLAVPAAEAAAAGLVLAFAHFGA
jgi:hypothetical protein